MDSNLLPDPLREQVERIGQADLLIGLPTFNNATTIELVGKGIIAGVAQSFPGTRTVVVNCDGGSQDGTPHLLAQGIAGAHTVIQAQHPNPTVHSLVMADHGVPGYENAYRMIFQAGEALQVHACAVVDGNLHSVTSEWMRRLLEPVVERQFDFVAPVYGRHKFDGSLTNSVIYPLNRALYGTKLRFMGGGAYAFSLKMVSALLAKPSWDRDVVRLGIENWMATVAVAEGYDVCQASLGARVLDSKGSGVEVSALLSHTVGSVFSLMEEYQAVWEIRRGSDAVYTSGPPWEVGTEPVTVSPARMVNAFKQGLRDLLPIWEIILSSDAVAQILPLGLLDAEEFRFPNELWVQVVYDFALGYHDKAIYREHLLKALTPLYLGRTASFILENRPSDGNGVERRIEQLCAEYETQKPYLVARWR